MTPGLEIFIAQCLLIFGLTTPGFAAYTGVYLALAAMIFGFLPKLQDWSSWKAEPGYRFLGASILLLLVPMPFHWSGVEDLYPLLVIVPVLLAPGAAALVRRHPKILSPETLSWALLAGIAVALAVASFEALVLHKPRPGAGNNPIHFADIATILGFGALAGVFFVKSHIRLLFFAGPVLAAAAVLLSGSRGPAVTIVALAMVALGFLVWQWRRSKLAWLLPVAAVIAGAVILFALKDMPAVQRVTDAFLNAPAMFNDVSLVLNDDRLYLIVGALGSFFDAPLFGHGFTQMMQSIVPHVPVEHADVANYDHLHSDLSDFGVSGGLFGLAALAALLLSPIGAAFRHAGKGSFAGMLYLAIVMALGYLLLGLTNAVIGMLPQTALFGVLLGFIVGTGQASPPGDD